MIPATPPAPQYTAPLQPGDLVNEIEAAAILSCARKTLQNLRWRGQGPRWYKVGARLVRYHRADLAAFIEAGKGAERAA